MKNIIWTEDYLAEQLQKKKIFYYEQYKDYKIGDFFIECLDKEHIFNYSHMDGKLFKRCLRCDNTLSIVLEDNPHSTRCYTEHISKKAFDKFCESFKSREVRIKAMFFIHENVGEIWDDINPGEVQTNCAKIINADINEICKENPDISREDFEELLYDPNFFNVKTCSRLWHEKLHNKFVSSDFFSEDTSEQEKVEDEVTVEQSQNEEQPVEVNKSEEEVNHVEENDFPAETVPQEVPDSVIFNTSYWKPDDCKKEFKQIINACPEKRGKQMVIKKIREQSSYFYCYSLRHKQFAEELNRLQSKYKFTKADVATAFRRE